MRERLDRLLVQRGVVPDLKAAEAEVRAGNVLVDDVGVDKPGTKVPAEAQLRLRTPPLRYVSRGGLKLEAGLDAFGALPAGRVCADLGASTGGFTDCLLQRGASRVYAVDVGYGQLAWSLRQDPRVVVMERTNARLLSSFPEPVTLITGDLSFISARAMLPSVRKLLAPGGEAVLLVKPQFELERAQIGPGGVVQGEADRREALTLVCEAARGLGFEVRGHIESPIAGAKAGNREWLLHLA
ncbi:TlyA family rRNA (cytidine-2'-O)-methyltransferase [Deltaproteobacteria bacterium]|nr:TlyA family rRNA (cytidine-2'-O)-methyltransferase [Deltaproteobacteria bacterium]